MYCSFSVLLMYPFSLQFQLLTDAILDVTVVSGVNRGLQQTIGDLMFSTFKSTICTYIAKESKNIIPLLSQKAESNSRRVSSVLVNIIDHVTRDKSLRKR